MALQPDMGAGNLAIMMLPSGMMTLSARNEPSLTGSSGPGSPIVATLFDQLVDMIEEWLVLADEQRPDPPTVDRRARAAVFNAMVLGVPLMHEHISRVLGVDITSVEGDRLLALALLDLHSHILVTPELAATAQAALQDGARRPDTSAIPSPAHPRRRR